MKLESLVLSEIFLMGKYAYFQPCIQHGKQELLKWNKKWIDREIKQWTSIMIANTINWMRQKKKDESINTNNTD